MQLLLLLTGHGQAWVDRHILDPGRLPLLLALFAFIMTFLVTRTITRLIRAGRGPFRNRVSPEGVHVHHAVPGLVVLLIGAFGSLAAHDARPWINICGLLVGMGASLLLDEFALILHLRDVYWSGEGRVSVELVALAAACLALLTIGLQPFHFTTTDSRHQWVHLALLAGLPIHLIAEVVVVLKGKYHVALIGAFAGPVAFFAALTLARPKSWWGRRYGPEKLALARDRSMRWDAKWGRLTAKIADFVAGSHAPSRPGEGRYGPPYD